NNKRRLFPLGIRVQMMTATMAAGDGWLLHIIDRSVLLQKCEGTFNLASGHRQLYTTKRVAVEPLHINGVLVEHEGGNIESFQLAACKLGFIWKRIGSNNS